MRHGSGPRSLIVDPCATMRRTLREALARHGWRDGVEADHGRSALALLRARRFDAVLCDGDRLHEPNALELLRALRADAALADLPVMIVSAQACKERLIGALEAGAAAYLVTPFTPETFERKLARLLPLTA